MVSVLHKNCIVDNIFFCCPGSIISSMTVRAIYGKHRADLDASNLVNSEVLASSRSKARSSGTLEEQKAVFFQKWQDDANKRVSEFDK